MKKIKRLFCLIILLTSSTTFAQQNTAITAEELLPMYRTWVKTLLFVIVLLSVALLIIGIKYYKLKQDRESKNSTK